MSEEKSNSKFLIVVVLLLCVGCIYAGSQLFPKTITNIQYDTLTVEKKIEVPIEKIVYKYLKATKLETLYVEAHIQDIVAKLDTVLKSSDTQSVAYSDSINVAYHFPPLNYFDISLGLQPRQVIVQEKYITKTVEVEKSKLFDFSLGGLVKDIGLVAGGYLLCEITHKNNPIQYQVGINVPINITKEK